MLQLPVEIWCYSSVMISLTTWGLMEKTFIDNIGYKTCSKSQCREVQIQGIPVTLLHVLHIKASLCSTISYQMYICICMDNLQDRIE